MSNNFDKYKNFLKKKLTDYYNSQLITLNKNLNNNINIILRSNISNSKKTISINNLINIYKNNVNNLKNYYNTQLDIINKMTMPILNNIYNSTNSNNKKSLCIGINYKGSPYELYGCINDANSIKDFLIKCGFTNNNVITDSTDYNTGILPNKDNILIAITNLLQEAKSGDILFLFYSGHGSYIIDKNRDDLTGYDQLIIPCDFKAIVDDDLKKIIDNYLKDGVLLICLFDSCFSGSVLDLKYMYNDNTFTGGIGDGIYNENNNETETKGNVILISGCSDLQTSADAVFDNKNNGALTWSFLNSLNNNDGKLNNISWNKLLLSMRNLLKSNNFSQTPQLSSGKFINVDENIPLTF